MLKSIRNIIVRCGNSAVVWTWLFSGLRIGCGMVLLAFLARELPTAEFGMYCVFFALMNVLPILDFGFSANIGRSINFAMGGAENLCAEGVPDGASASGPNYALLWKLLKTTRWLYRLIALFATVIVGTVGTVVVALRVHQTASPLITWTSWVITLLAIAWELYAGWWATFVRGMNLVLPAAKIVTVVYALNFVIACGLLLGGGGLLSVPIASLATNLLQRYLMRRLCLQSLPKPSSASGEDVRAILKLLWPNTWRLGLQMMTYYIASNLIIFLRMFDLNANAEYGLSARLVMMMQTIAIAWVTVKWPVIGKYRAQRDFPALRRLIWPRLWLQGCSFVILSVGLLLLGQPFLTWIGTAKRILPPLWLGLMILNTFLEMRFSFWGTLIFTENRMPYVWPAIATNILSTGLTFILLEFTTLGFGALVLSPLIAGCLFNYWYWPIYGAKTIQTGWFEFVFQRKHVAVPL